LAGGVEIKLPGFRGGSAGKKSRTDWAQGQKQERLAEVGLEGRRGEKTEPRPASVQISKMLFCPIAATYRRFGFGRLSEGVSLEELGFGQVL